MRSWAVPVAAATVCVACYATEPVRFGVVPVTFPGGAAGFEFGMTRAELAAIDPGSRDRQTYDDQLRRARLYAERYAAQHALCAKGFSGPDAVLADRPNRDRIVFVIRCL